MTEADSVGSTSESAFALEPPSCVLRHVAKTSRAVVAAFDPAFAPLGLTGHQFNLMTTLDANTELSVGTLAGLLGMDASGIPRAIRPLVDQELLTVERGTDRRQRVLSLTDAGRQRIAKATQVWREVQGELMETIGSERWMTLIDELRAVRTAAVACSTRTARQSA